MDKLVYICTKYQCTWIQENLYDVFTGARVEIEDKRGNTALHTAARHGHASVTKTLVSNGANVLKRGAGGMLPVHMACLSGYSDCVENLIPRGMCNDDACVHA